MPEDLREALDHVAQRQGELAEAADELVREAEAAADAAVRSSNTPEDRALARTFQEVAAIAKREGLVPRQDRASENLAENRPSQAGADQQQALDTLARMMQELGQRDNRLREELERQLAELADKIERVLKLQTALNAQTDEAADAGLAALNKPQFDIRVKTILLEAESTQVPNLAAVGEALASAVRGQEKAVLSLQQAKRPNAQVGQAEALKHLKEALDLISQENNASANQETMREREKLKQRYLKLVTQQQELKASVEAIASKAQVTRRDLVRSVQLGRSQQELREAIQEVGAELEETLVFKATHTRLDRAAGSAVERLEARKPDAQVVADQQAVIDLLMRMVRALGDQNPDDEWERDEGQGEAGGGGGGGPMPLVPPIAELRLLRQLQQDLRDQTEAVRVGDAAVNAASQRTRLEQLGSEQRMLADLADQMIENFKKSMQAPDATGEGGS